MGSDEATSVETAKKFTDLRLYKGKKREVNFYAWTGVENCREEKCPIFDSCSYVKDKKRKCSLQVSFMKSLHEVILEEPKLTEQQLFRVGMTLAPLFKILCRLYIYEMTSPQVMLVSKKGIRPNPIFKEIRETVSAISREWNAIGLNPDRYVSLMGNGNPLTRDEERGDANYHSYLEGRSGENPTSVKRRLLRKNKADT